MMVHRFLRSKQRGSAIISALLLMSIMAILAVSLLTRQNVEIRRTAIILQEQRFSAQLAWVELWAIEQLTAVLQALTEEQNYITLEQAWVEPLIAFQQEGLIVSGAITDLQSRFNINNLLATRIEPTSVETGSDKSGSNDLSTAATSLPLVNNQVEKPDPFDQATPFTTAWIFARLITLTSQTNLIDAQVMSEKILHWIGQEVNADDNYYLMLDHPYQPGHQPLHSISELRLIQQLDNALIGALQPHIAAYVTQDHRKKSTKESSLLFPINVNTTDATMLAAILNIDKVQADTILDSRPFYTLTSLQQTLSRFNLTAEFNATKTMLTNTSQYFLVKAVVRDDRRAIVQYSIVKHKAQGQMVVIHRVRGEM